MRHSLRNIIRQLVGPVMIAVLLLTGCSSSSRSSSSTTTTAPQTLSVSTAQGTVTVSLDGHLPPGWPSDFPIPPGATPLGSGSLAGSTSASMIGVFESTASGQDDYTFYKNSKTITISDANSVGVGSSFVGHLTLSGKYAGSVTIADVQGRTLIVVALTHHPSNAAPVSGAR